MDVPLLLLIVGLTAADRATVAAVCLGIAALALIILIGSSTTPRNFGR
jgi:hypothetical protein